MPGTVVSEALQTTTCQERQEVALGPALPGPALSDQTRWRRRTVEGCATEYVDFWESAELGWVTRFHIRTEGAVAGRGLFAARDYAKGEHVAVYMGVDMGKSGRRQRAEQHRNG